MENNFRFKDPVSALTHFGGFVFSIVAMPVVLCIALYFKSSLKATIAASVMIISMTILYGASATYHTFDVSKKINLILKKIDHCSIFILIAGSYTPVCLTYLIDDGGVLLLCAVWAIAIAGIIFKLFFVTCPKWVSSVMYIMMGWMAVFSFPSIIKTLPMVAFGFLLTGGILYTVGGVIYALKPRFLIRKERWGFGNHELFHIFVLAGSLCHVVTTAISLV